MASHEERHKVVAHHLEQASREFRSLRLVPNEKNGLIIRGNIGFTVPWDGIELQDSYEVEIIIPEDYPDRPPSIREIGGRIPREPRWHVNANDGTLCLSAPHAVKCRFARYRNLLGFIREQVVPFLFWVSYKREYGHAPFGQLSHGAEGILEYYRKLFSTTDDQTVLRLLMMLAYPPFREDVRCPCESGFKFKKCHQKVLKKASKHQSPEQFREEYRVVYDYLQASDSIRTGQSPSYGVRWR